MNRNKMRKARRETSGRFWAAGGGVEGGADVREKITDLETNKQ
jgi:hypothetical protein